MKIAAVIFDLDNTIADTSALKEIREARDYQACERVIGSIKIHDAANKLINFLEKEGVKLGVVTNSPRWYAEKVLKHLGVFNKIQCLVTYNEVESFGIKPKPDGIKIALRELGILEPSKVFYIGDEGKDVIASYHAGVLPVIGSWTNRAPLSDTPFGVLSYRLIRKNFSEYTNLSLIAERCAEENTFSATNNEIYFLPLDSNGNILSTPEDLVIYCFGRYFSQKNEITARLHDSHKLSLEIFKKENTENIYKVPNYWIQIFSNLIKNIATYGRSRVDKFDIVTVIPAKKNKIKRLEEMLELMKSLNLSVCFISDLFYFEDDAPSLKSLPKDQRLITLEQYLKIDKKYVNNIADKNILILDDVITTGSTMKVARQILLNLNANEVLGACIAKTVSLQREFKQCQRCQSELILRKNKNNGSRFWACPLKNINGEYCGYTENIKEKDCPECGRPMYRRTNHVNKSVFLACSGYYEDPFCNHTESLENCDFR